MEIKIITVDNIPEIKEGDAVEEIIGDCLLEQGLPLQDKDIIVIAQKVVSRAEGRIVKLDEVKPSPEAQDLADKTGVSPETVQLMLDESSDIIRSRPGLIIPRHRLGFVCANAGIDRSNTGRSDGKAAVLLPLDPDASACRIRKGLEKKFKTRLSVIINDSQGRPFREGAVGVAIGISGIKPLKEHINREDLFGYVLKSSNEGIVDEIASAATLLMGQSNEGIPAVVVRGLDYHSEDYPIGDIIREKSKDLFI